MKSKKVLLLLVAVFFLNFCSLHHSHSPRTMPEQITADDTTESTAEEPVEDTSANEVKTVDPIIPSVPKPNTERVVESLNIIEQLVFQTGEASWYGHGFHGKRTANGEVYDMHKLTAAHLMLPFHTLVEVENLDNRKKVIVRINDRGPHLKGRIIDLSKNAASRLGMVETGIAPVHLRIYIPGGVPQYNTLPQAEPPIAQSPQSETGLFYLQLGAFSVRENAQQMINHLDDVMPDIPFSIQSQNNLYKVLSKLLDTRQEATQLLQRLKENGFDAFIIIHNP